MQSDAAQKETALRASAAAPGSALPAAVAVLVTVTRMAQSLGHMQIEMVVHLLLYCTGWRSESPTAYAYRGLPQYVGAAPLLSIGSRRKN
jgi:hypothetical protein